jgi:hypothetical protein
MSVRNLVGRALIALVVVNAAAGVLALILSSSKQIGSFEGHILLTTGAVSLAIAAGLPCALAWEKRGLTAAYGLPALAIAAIALAMALTVALVWTDSPTDDLTDIAWSAFAIAFALALISLLSLADLPPRQNWVRLVACALAVLFAAQMIYLLWGPEPSDGAYRRFGATGILLAGASSVVPVLQRMGAVKQQDAPGFCPRCGAALAGVVGRRALCSACGAAFRVEFS